VDLSQPALLERQQDRNCATPDGVPPRDLWLEDRSVWHRHVPYGLAEQGFGPVDPDGFLRRSPVPSQPTSALPP